MALPPTPEPSEEAAASLSHVGVLAEVLFEFFAAFLCDKQRHAFAGHGTDGSAVYGVLAEVDGLRPQETKQFSHSSYLLSAECTSNPHLRDLGLGNQIGNLLLPSL